VIKKEADIEIQKATQAACKRIQEGESAEAVAAAYIQAIVAIFVRHEVIDPIMLKAAGGQDISTTMH
jgi:hypothetical protein